MTCKTMKAFRIAGSVSLGFLFSTPIGARAEAVDETRDFTPAGRVQISNVSGSIRVLGWDKAQIQVAGTLGEGTERLVFEVADDVATIEVKLPRNARDVDESHLEIHLPKGSRVDAEGVSAWIEVSEVEGRLELESVSGDVTVTGKPAEVSAASVSGEVDVDARTSRIEAEVSGGIAIRNAAGRIEASSVSGTVDVAGGELAAGSFETVSGSIEFDGSFGGDGRFEFESHSGDIRLVLPDDVDAEFEISTFSGDIENDFGERSARERRHGPGEELYFTVGKGRAEVSATTFSGSVEIVKAR
jgi:DUF4097 and DUF4098 domain-containing protein YvlB